IILEYIPGISLAQLITLLALNENQCKAIIKQVASGLQHLHLLGIIHRDLKGSNVLIRETGLIKLVDFGIAKFTRDLPVTHSQATYTGTSGFVAPEILRQTGQYTDLSDVWSVGCLILQLLCRQGWPSVKFYDVCLPNCRECHIDSQAVGVASQKRLRPGITLTHGHGFSGGTGQDVE
ncbi:kinase-like domain-containing protein, partial [Mycena pura]